MGVLKYLTHTNTTYQVTSSQAFIERVHLIGSGISTLMLYDGTGTDGRVVAILGCAANGADEIIVNEKCSDGVYVVMTTGAGISKAIIYDR